MHASLRTVTRWVAWALGAAGVRVGDELRSVEGESMDGLTAAAAASALRGRPGTRVELVLMRGTTVRTLHLMRAVVPFPGVGARMLTAHVGRIVVPAFTRG